MEKKNRIPDIEISTYSPNGEFTYSPNCQEEKPAISVSYFRDRSRTRTENKNGGTDDRTNKVNK